LSLVTIQAMKPNPAFDLGRDFAPITLLAKQAVVLVVNPQSNLHSVSELIALAKSKPGEVLCANVGGRQPAALRGAAVCPSGRN